MAACDSPSHNNLVWGAKNLRDPAIVIERRQIFFLIRFSEEGRIDR